MDDISGKWYLETIFPDLVMMVRVEKMLYSGKTEYQNVEILESGIYGRSLVLDGKTQSTERDEHIYHESLVHPAMLMHPGPRAVFIGGGGEGGTLREVLSHQSVEQVVMLDLDREVVDLCRRYLPKHHQGSFDDPRVELRHEDARAYLRDCGQQFDIMIMDLVDPMEGGPAYLLYTQQYYDIVKSRMNPGGVMVTQSGPAGLLTYRECFTTIVNTLRSIFADARGYHVDVPAFQTVWGLTLASESPMPDFSDPQQIDELIARRINKPLKFYDGITHQSLFNLPKFLRQGIQEESRVNSDEAPVFMV